MRARSLVPVVLVMVFAAGCGSSPPPSAASPSAAAASAPAPAIAAPPVDPEGAPAKALSRSAVHQTIVQGLGAFLQRVAVDDRPVMEQGKFKGFRIAALNGASFWRGVDLKPGDVVTRVNGFSIEHPEDALEAFRSLEVASELRIDYEREGKPRAIRYVIVEDGAAPAAAVHS